VFSLNVWVELHPNANTLVTMSDLRYMIEKNLREAGIVVAFPQRDVHLDVSRPVRVEVLGTDGTRTEPERGGPAPESGLAEPAAAS